MLLYCTVYELYHNVRLYSFVLFFQNQNGKKATILYIKPLPTYAQNTAHHNAILSNFSVLKTYNMTDLHQPDEQLLVNKQIPL